MTGLFYLSSCTSTNDEVLPLISMQHQQYPIGVYTFHQTTGRGQYGNTWENSKDENLAITIAFLKKDMHLSTNLFNYYTAIVLRDFIANMSEKEVAIKWPNDIILEGKKVSGILIEKVKIKNDEYYIVGVGVNVLQEKFPNIDRAGSIFSQTGKRFDLHDFAQRMYEFFNMRFLEKSTNLDVVDGFNQHLFRKNKISVFVLNGVRQNGIIKSVHENGQLLIDLEHDGLVCFSHKEIELLY